MTAPSSLEVALLASHLMTTAKSEEDVWFDSHGADWSIDETSGEVVITWKQWDQIKKRTYRIAVLDVEESEQER